MRPRTLALLVLRNLDAAHAADDASDALRTAALDVLARLDARDPAPPSTRYRVAVDSSK